VRAAGAKQNRKDDSIQTPARKQTMQADVHEFAFTTVSPPYIPPFDGVGGSVAIAKKFPRVQSRDSVSVTDPQYLFPFLSCLRRTEKKRPTLENRPRPKEEKALAMVWSNDGIEVLLQVVESSSDGLVGVKVVGYRVQVWVGPFSVPHAHRQHRRQ
jgi:hypothetical protein